MAKKGMGKISLLGKENCLGVKDVRSIIVVLKESMHGRYVCLFV